MIPTLIGGKWVEVNRLTLSEAFLEIRPYAFDPTAWETMLGAFAQVQESEREEFHAAARTLPYPEFLTTVYWGIVRGWVLHRYHRLCGGCGSSYARDTHHLTYEYRGSDHLHLETLVALCRACHAHKHFPTDQTQAAFIERRKFAGVTRARAMRKAGEYWEIPEEFVPDARTEAWNNPTGPNSR